MPNGNRLMDEKQSLPCPGCGQSVHVSLRRLARARAVTCPEGHEIEVSDSMRRSAASTVRSFDKVLGAFGRLGKTR